MNAVHLNERLWRMVGWVCIAAILSATVIGILQPRGLGLDFANFYDAGRKALNGEFASLYDPFAPIDGEAPFGNMLFFSFPISSYGLAPMAALSPKLAAIVFKTFGALCIFSGLAILFVRYRKFVEPQDRTMFFGLFCAAAMFFQPFWTIFQVGGQTTPLVFLMFVLAMLAYERRMFWQTVALYTAIVLVKPVFVVGAGILFLIGPWRFRFWCIGIGLGAFAISVAILGWPLHQVFLRLMTESSGKMLGTPYFNSHLLGWIEPLFLRQAENNTLDDTRKAIALLGRVLRLAIIAWGTFLIWRMSRTDLPDPARRNIMFLSSMMASLAFAPVVWSHYLMLLFIPIVHMIARRRDFSGLFLGTLCLVVMVAPFQNRFILNQFIKAFWPLSDLEVLILTICKSLVMLLLTLAIFAFPRQIERSYRAVDWR